MNALRDAQNGSKRVSKLLINEPPLQVLPTLAKAIGLNEAIVLQQIHYYSLRSRDDGWVIQPITDWVDPKKNGDFKFWSKDTLERVLRKLKADTLIEVEVVGIGGGQGGARRQARMRVNFAALEALELKISEEAAICGNLKPQSAATSSRNLRQPRTNSLTEREKRDTPLGPPKGGRGRRGSSSRGSRGPSSSWFGGSRGGELPGVVGPCPTVVAMDAAQAWATAATELRKQVNDTAWAWLEVVHAHGFDADGTLVLACPSEVHGWIKQRYAPLISQTLGRTFHLHGCSGAERLEPEDDADAGQEANSA